MTDSIITDCIRVGGNAIGSFCLLVHLCLYICFHSVIGTDWPLTLLNICMQVCHDHSSQGLQVKVKSWVKLMQSVRPRSRVFFFSFDLAFAAVFFNFPEWCYSGSGCVCSWIGFTERSKVLCNLPLAPGRNCTMCNVPAVIQISLCHVPFCTLETLYTRQVLVTFMQVHTIEFQK